MKEESKPLKGRGGNMKKTAPPGFYTAAEAIKKLGLNTSTFRYYVRQGKIKQHIPPLKSNGFYDKREIDRLATEMALFFHTHATEGTETRIGTPEDVQGIYDVLDSFGWQTAPIDLRLEWYKVNPFIDYIVRGNGEVVGYITAVPYTPDAMEAIMHGDKRAWHMKPEDILPYHPGRKYDLYVGAATKQNVANHTAYAFRLISGFMDFLRELATQDIIIQHMYAVSNQPDGQRLCKALGFVEQEAIYGDLFPRFELDLEHSQSRFAIMYQEALQAK